MKGTIKLFLLTIAVLWGVTSCAQKQNLETVVIPNHEKYEFSYDDKGNLIFKTYYVWNNKQWKKCNEYKYIYDNKGNLSSQFYYDNLEEEWTESNFTYGDKGNLISTATSFRFGEDGTIEYTYDAKGNVIKKISYTRTCPGNDVEKYEYMYDDKDNLIVEVCKNGVLYEDTTEWEDKNPSNWKKEYKYNVKGNLLEIIHTTPTDCSKFEFTYDNKDNLILKMEYHLKDTKWEKSWKEEYEYDNRGNRLKKCFGWIGEDSNGDMWNGDGWEGEHRCGG